ncbi:MAG: cytidine deaminase [Actinomycetota bacterium]|nr:cytidine deaminase [Actinomycetota bacterium]
MPDIDWDALQEAAVAIMANAYAPYSRFKVGVAGLLDDGRIVVGCNVENASYGLQLLWEHGRPSTLLRTPEGILPLSEILPQAFGPSDLVERAEDRTLS